MRPNTVATTNPVRITATSSPVRAASPAATPPATRFSRLRRNGPLPGGWRSQGWPPDRRNQRPRRPVSTGPTGSG